MYVLKIQNMLRESLLGKKHLMLYRLLPCMALDINNNTFSCITLSSHKLIELLKKILQQFGDCVYLIVQSLTKKL